MSDEDTKADGSIPEDDLSSSDSPADPPPAAAPPPPPAGAAPPPPPSGGAPPHGHVPPSSPPAGGTESPNRQLFIVLSYLWLLALIPFLLEKDDREVQWHAKHGLVLLVAEIALWIGLNIVQWAAGAVLGPLACFGCIGFAIVAVGEIVLHVACIVKGLGGERLIIPGLSEYADRL